MFQMNHKILRDDFFTSVWNTKQGIEILPVS